MVRTVVVTIVAAVAGALIGSLIAYFLGLQRSRYERLEERRAEVLAELSRLMFEVDEKYFSWYLPSLRGGHTLNEVREESKERGLAAVESLQVLIRYFHSTIAWLDTETAASVESFIEEVREMGSAYSQLGVGNTHFQLTDKGKEIAGQMQSRIPEIREEIIGEFRDILYPKPWWKHRFPYRLRFKAPDE